MRFLLLAAILFLFMQANAQPKYTRAYDDDTKELVYVGELVYYDLEKEPEFKWFVQGAYQYKADTAAVAYLRKHLKDYEMVTFLGTWCEDSKELIPKLYRVLHEAGYPTKKQHTMYALDLYKKGLYGEAEEYGIEAVPTIILYKNGEEAGRIVETTVADTIEEDLQAIIEDYEL